MIIYLLITLNLVMPLLIGVYFFRLHKNIPLSLVYAWHIILFSLKPFIMYRYDLTFFFFQIESIESIGLYLFVGLLFILVFSIAFYFFINMRTSIDKVLRLFNFHQYSNLSIAILVIFFLIVSYVANSIKYNDLLYFYKNYNLFEATMNLAQGGWYLNVLSDLSAITMLVLLIRNVDKKAIIVLFMTVLLLASLYFINKTASRTQYAVLLLSVVIYYQSIGRIKLNLFNVTMFGFVLINLLFFANLARAGLTFGREYSLLVPLLSLITDLNPADCGIMLLHNKWQFDWLYFKYILLSPIAILPRALLPFKPDTGIEAIITAKLFGEGFYNNSTQTFTIPVMGYMNASYLGVIVTAIIFAFITAILYKGTFSKNKYISIMSIYYIMVVLSLYRTSLETTLVSLFTVILFFGIFHFICYPTRKFKITV